MFRDFRSPLHTGTQFLSKPPRPAPAHPARRTENVRLGTRCNGRPMQPAALRVLETTWRVWREPLA